MDIQFIKRTDLGEIPKRDWNKELAYEGSYRGKEIKIYAVNPQAHLVGKTESVGLLSDFTPDSILVKAFEKNYKTPAKPKVVQNYGFVQKHGEPLELIDFTYECIFDRACEAEINRYRHNSKNYESGRYVDYIKHGVTVVYPMELYFQSPEGKKDFIINDVLPAFKRYIDYLINGVKKQHARRVFGTYLAVESVIKVNLRSLGHMGAQRSHKYSPNGKEAEPQISEVITQMIEQTKDTIPVFYDVFIEEIGKGYR